MLVVEDDPQLAKFFERIVSAAGWEPLKAHDGESALRIFREEDPLAVLLDVGLPGSLNGLDVLDRRG